VRFFHISFLGEIMPGQVVSHDKFIQTEPARRVKRPIEKDEVVVYQVDFFFYFLAFFSIICFANCLHILIFSFTPAGQWFKFLRPFRFGAFC